MDKGRAVGFAIWRDAPDEVTLEKIGVRPDSRNRGTGTKLLWHVVRQARNIGATQVTLLVPEINCFPGHPDDVSQWLLGRRFRTKAPIVKNYAFMYGQWVDGFQFVRPIEKGFNEPVI
jgi:GNAT superfamily N-acetyltransferase